MRVVASLLALLFVFGCGGGGGGGGGGSLDLAPGTPTVRLGATQQFSATSGGAGVAVTWSVQEGASGGAITPGGLYTAPSTAGTYHVIATSVANPGQTATVAVRVPVSVSVDPPSFTTTLGHSRSLTATVAGTANQAVTWTVQEPAGGSVTPAGVYTAPAATSGTFHVVAASQVDAGQTAVTTVTVQAGSLTGTIQ